MRNPFKFTAIRAISSFDDFTLTKMDECGDPKLEMALIKQEASKRRCKRKSCKRHGCDCE